MSVDNSRVLILQEKLPEYRIALFNEIASHVKKLTVVHSEKKIKNNSILFEELVLEKKKIGPFAYYKELKNVISDNDIVVTMFSLSWPQFYLLPKLHSQKFFFLWGIGVSTTPGYDLNKSKDFLRLLLAKMYDAIIFYTQYPIKKYIAKGINEDKLFVANNTVFCDAKINFEERNFKNFVFIGSLTKRKGLKLLMESFLDIPISVRKNIILQIVGDGEERVTLEAFAEKYDKENTIHFLGRITSQEKKREILTNAICSISPKQAGLSVLDNFAYGVPFLTFQDSITGGERFNITNGVNGFLVSNKNELKVKMIQLIENENLAKQLGQNAYNFYWENRRIEQMAASFIKAFKKKESIKK